MKFAQCMCTQHYMSYTFSGISLWMSIAWKYIYIYIYTKVKWSPYRPGVTQRVGRGITLLFHDCGTRSEWVVSSTPRPHSIPGKDPVPIVQEAGWAPGPVWTGGKSNPHRDSITDRPNHSQSLYRLSHPAQIYIHIYIYTHTYIYIRVCVCVNGIHIYIYIYIYKRLCALQN